MGGWQVVSYPAAGLHNLLQPGSRAARKWRENEEMERDSHFIFPLFSPSLSISCIKNSLILTQNVKYGTFVANVLENLSYVL